jgi:CRISPR-associated protein Csm2
MESMVLWKDREAQALEPTLFSEKAERFAKQLARDNENNRARVNKRTQLRKFYDEVTRLNQLAKAQQGRWENILPMVHMLTAKAAYASGRKLVSDNFLDFIRSCVNQVETRRDLEVFSSLFEAIMGFYRLHGPNN